MNAQSLAAVGLVALTCAGIAYAGAGPISPLYLTEPNSPYDIIVVQGNSVINDFPMFYGPTTEFPIAVYGDVRTTGDEFGSIVGGQYTLGGTPTGTTYLLPAIFGGDTALDSTSDGSHNYLVDYQAGTVYQTARDFTSPVALFTAVGANPLGITYDAANNSLWLSDWNDSTVANYSLSGTLLSSFSTGHINNGALALDPADHTLWLVNYFNRSLEQYSQSGALLGIGPGVPTGAYGGEFNLAAAPVPEPGSLVLFGSGILGFVGLLRRKIKL